MSSLFQRVFNKLDEAKKAQERRQIQNYGELCKVICDHVKGQPPKTFEDEDDCLEFVEMLIAAGVATPEQIQTLHDAATQLHGYIAASELPAIDEEAAEKNFRKVADKARADLAAAEAAVHRARDHNGERMAARQEAQRHVNKFPELAELFEGCSWQPRIQPVPKPAKAGSMQYENH